MPRYETIAQVYVAEKLRMRRYLRKKYPQLPWVETEDIVQEAFLQVWERRLTLDPQVPWDAWAYGFARKVALGWLAQSRILAYQPSLEAAFETFDQIPLEAPSVVEREEPSETLHDVWRQQIGDWMVAGWSSQRILDELQRVGQLPPLARSRVGQQWRYQRKQERAQQEGWCCQVCGHTDHAFKSKTLCQPCYTRQRQARAVPQPSAAGPLCKECERPGVKLKARGLCSACYDRRLAQGEFDHKLTFVCRGCQQSDRLHHAGGYCGRCYSRWLKEAVA
jgi:DNA-directed RNA polymerase specialized sigma24 family protein